MALPRAPSPEAHLERGMRMGEAGKDRGSRLKRTLLAGSGGLRWIRGDPRPPRRSRVRRAFAAGWRVQPDFGEGVQGRSRARDFRTYGARGGKERCCVCSRGGLASGREGGWHRVGAAKPGDAWALRPCPSMPVYAFSVPPLASVRFRSRSVFLLKGRQTVLGARRRGRCPLA